MLKTLIILGKLSLSSINLSPQLFVGPPGVHDVGTDGHFLGKQALSDAVVDLKTRRSSLKSTGSGRTASRIF
jgi:hypothetical protein